MVRFPLVDTGSVLFNSVCLLVVLVRPGWFLLDAFCWYMLVPSGYNWLPQLIKGHWYIWFLAVIVIYC